MASSSFIKFVTSDPLIFVIISFACIGGFLFGYDQGVVSAILTMESFGAQFPRVYSDADFKGWCVSTFLLCAWFGSLLNSPIIEKYGRKKTIIIACTVFVVGSSFQTAGKSYAMLFAGRGVSGLAVGSLTTTVPILLSEFVPATNRGSLVVCQQLMITIGILFSYWIGYGTNYIGGTHCVKNPSYSTFDPYTDVPEGGCTGQSTASWRIPLGIQILPALILGTGMFFLPESPRWLLSQGEEEKSWDILKYLRRKEDLQKVEEEFSEMRAEVIFEKDYAIRKFGKDDVSAFTRYVDLLTTKSHFKRVFIGSAVMFFQQFIGCNAIIYYAPTIFSMLSMGANTTSLLGTGVYGIVNTLSTLPAVFLIDKVGRKPLLMCGAAGTFASLIIVGAILGRYGDSLGDHVTASRTAIAFIYIYDLNFSYSWAPIGWVLPSEIFPISVRAKAVSITTSSTWMSNFIIGLVTPRMLDTMNWGTYIFFAAFALIAFFFTFFIIPETKGRPLEEMDQVFNDIEVANEKRAIAESTLKNRLVDSDSKVSVGVEP